MTIGQWEKAFPTEEACSAYLVANRWPNGAIVCPRCGSVEKISPVKTMAFKWQCYACSPDSGYRFSHIAGTIFENTNKPLRDWFRVIHMMLTSKKGISALQVYRVMGFGSYSTAHYMCHRIRAALANEDFRKLMGIVEADETYIGGSGSNQHKATRKRYGTDARPFHHTSGRSSLSNKSIVAGAVERKGNVVARVIQNVSADVLTKFLNETVSDKVSLLCTDAWRGYGRAKKTFPHETVDHKIGEYARREIAGVVHTNTIEGFWSLVKRGIVGSYHKVSRKYLPLYVAEFQFRYNNRNNADIFAEAVRGC